jgi:hypothetical protein
VLYTTPGTRFYGDESILTMALRGGDAIRDFQYPDGRVEFLKVDGSRWGPTYMGWTNYAWLETYALLRDKLGEERRTRWEEGLTLAHDGQAAELRSMHVHNIPCWKGMSCYRAGVVFDRPDWREAGAAMAQAVAQAQQPGGYWAEHGGPSVLYNHVYVHGLGLYYVFSGDRSVLPALTSAADFHEAFSYPNGVVVETVDGRVQYHDRIMTMGWVGFAATAKGRRLVRHLARNLVPERDMHSFQGGSIASTVQHLPDGDEEETDLDRPVFRKRYQDWALVCRHAPWFTCMSAFVCPPVASRWGQDRQAFLSLWHEAFGLIFGGGNSNTQPEWSSFVADGRFVPDTGQVLPDDSGVALTYGSVTCTLRVTDIDAERIVVEARAEGGPARHQLVLQAKPGQTVRSAAGRECVLGKDAVRWGPGDLSEWISVDGIRVSVPPGAEFRWPTAPFNPYAADGAPPFGSERGILCVHIETDPVRWSVTNTRCS